MKICTSAKLNICSCANICPLAQPHDDCDNIFHYKMHSADEVFCGECSEVDQQPLDCPSCGHPMSEHDSRDGWCHHVIDVGGEKTECTCVPNHAAQEQKHCDEECANCEGDGCFHAELKAVHDAPEQPTPMPLREHEQLQLLDLMGKGVMQGLEPVEATKLISLWYRWYVEQQPAHDAAIRAQAVKEFADSLLKYTHDHNCASDLDVALNELVAIKRVGKLKEGGEQHPNSESCYDAIEALKAFIAHIRTEGGIE